MYFNKKRRRTNRAEIPRNPVGQNTSPQRVNSYYTASKKQITTFQRHTEQTRTKRTSWLSRFKRYGLMSVAAILLLIAILAMFTLSKTASITIDGGGAYRTATEYQKVVAEALGTSFQNNLKLSLDTKKLEAAIKEQLPEAYTVSVYAPLFGRNQEVIITTAPPFAVVLQDDPQKSLLLSNRGRLVMESSASTVDTSQLPTITNQSGTSLKSGDQLFKPEEMEAINGLQYQYTKGDTQIATVAYILPSAPREIHVQEGAYIAKFSLQLDSPIAQQYGALRAVQSQLQQQNKTPSEYIDVRLASKVFIK